MSRDRRRLATALLCGSALIASCGFPVEDSPTPVAAEERPAEFDPQNTAPSLSTVEVSVWFVQGEELVLLPRQVPSPVDADLVMTSLGTGVTAQEVDRGLRSAIPDATMLIAADLVGGTATVQLAANFLEIAPGDQVLALGQIVLTLTGLPGVGRVRFEIDGESVATPLPDGTSTEDSVSREDYRSLAVAS